MEHVKLAHGGLHAGLHGASRAGVLRGVVKPSKQGGVRCWVLAAGIALAVTFVFVGITLWLGLSAATRMAAPTERPRDPFRDLRVAPPPKPHPHPHAHPPTPAPTRQPPAPAVHLPKKRKGQVEKVQQPDATAGDAVATPAPSTTSSTTTTTTSTTTTTTTTTSTTPPPPPEEQEPVTLPPPHHVVDVDVLARQPLQSAVAPPAPPPALPATPPSFRPPPPPRRPPTRVWTSPPPPSGPWSPPLELRPPPVPPPADDPMVAEAATAPEWRHGVAVEPPMAVDEPFHYDGAAPEEAESPVLVFMQDRLRSLKDWLAAAHAGQDWQDMVGAVNASLYRADPAPALRHLREMYYNTSLSAGEGDVPLASLVYPTDPAVLSNSSSLVSFGLLAFDLLLLRNVQLLARGEDGAAGERAEQLLKDPEVQALGALFMPPQEVRQLVHQDQGEPPASAPAPWCRRCHSGGASPVLSPDPPLARSYLRPISPGPSRPPVVALINRGGAE